MIKKNEIQILKQVEIGKYTEVSGGILFFPVGQVFLNFLILILGMIRLSRGQIFPAGLKSVKDRVPQKQRSSQGLVIKKKTTPTHPPLFFKNYGVGGGSRAGQAKHGKALGIQQITNLSNSIISRVGIVIHYSNLQRFIL